MKKATIRRLLKWSLPLNFVLIALVLLDYFRWGSDFIIPIFVAYGLYIVWLIVLLLLRAAAPFVRLSGHEETRTIIVYPRNHG